MLRVDSATGQIKPVSPAQVMQYWSTQRQNVQLMRRAEIPESTIDNYMAELQDILESPILNYPLTLSELGLDPESTYKEKKEILGISTAPFVESINQKRLDAFLKDKALQSRKANWSWRISQEVDDKQRAGWYPFFITLTIDPRRVEKEYESTLAFWKEGREWRKWIRSLVNVVCEELGHPPAHKKTRQFGYRPESDYVTYVGVIEHGKSREHHHAHVLVWMREIPSSWKQDPNRYVRDPKQRVNRECKPLSTMWKWSLPGLSPANYFRTKGDVWSKLGHGYPIDSNTGRPVIVGGPRQAAAYVTKYLQKELKEWHHRVKATRNLGLHRLKVEIKKLEAETVEALTWRPQSSSHLHLVSLIHSVPIGLMRSIAKQVDFSNKLEQGRLVFRDLMSSNTQVYSKMLKSVQAGVRPDRMRSSEFYDWVCGHLGGQKGYCEKRMLEAHSNFKEKFKRNLVNINSTVLGANDGSTSSIQNRSKKDRTSRSCIYRAS